MSNDYFGGGPEPPEHGGGQEPPENGHRSQAPVPSRASRHQQTTLGRLRSRGARPTGGPRLAVGARLRFPTVRASLGLGLALIVVTAVLGTATQALPHVGQPSTPPTRDPYSSRWICPLLPKRSGTVRVVNVGRGAGRLRTTVLAKGKLEEPKESELAAGKAHDLKLDPTKPGYVQVEAFETPVVVDSGNQPPCAASPADRWWIPGGDAAQGTDTTLVIANPNPEPAVVDIVPHVAEGSLQRASPSLAEVFVPAQSAVTKSLATATPGLRPVSEVIAKSGQVVAGAVVEPVSGGGEPTFLPGISGLRSNWAFARGLSGAGRRTDVLIANPNTEPLTVDVQVTTDKGTFTPPGPEFASPIVAGGTADIEIPLPEASKDGAFGVRVRSKDGARFVAVLRVTMPGGGGRKSFIDSGGSGLDRSWLLPAIKEGQRVVLSNLGPATTVRFVDAAAEGGGHPVDLPAEKVVVTRAPKGIARLMVEAPQEGVIAAPYGLGPVAPASAIGGVPAEGPIVPGPAAAP